MASSHLEQEATEAGRSHGWDHANYTNAYGGNLHATPDIPNRFISVRTYYLAGYQEGIERYEDDA